MLRKSLPIVLAAVMMMNLAGCATDGYYDPYRSAGVGALGGAATGAALGSIIGAATGSPATGAWVGAATGAIAGGVGGALYAAHQNRKRYEYPAAARSYGYRPGMASVVEVSDVSVRPGSVRPGQQVNLMMTYTILTGSQAPIPVTISREVRKDGVMVGAPFRTQVSNLDGTYTDQISFAVPPNAMPGAYSVISQVSSGYGTSQRISYFTVR